LKRRASRLPGTGMPVGVLLAPGVVPRLRMRIPPVRAQQLTCREPRRGLGLLQECSSTGNFGVADCRGRRGDARAVTARAAVCTATVIGVHGRARIRGSNTGVDRLGSVTPASWKRRFSSTWWRRCCSSSRPRQCR
jgi:hypothetical protein